MIRTVVSCFALAALAVATGGCQKEGCLGGDSDCRVPSPCTKVSFSCDSASQDKLAVATVTSTAERPGGWNAMAAKGDVKLSNAFVEVVIAGIGTQNFLDPNGGSILDLVPAGQARDSVNDIFQVTGILPRDAAFYTSLEIIDERPARVAVQVKGTLDGQPGIPIVTRYELTPCDRGVRVRTELVNGGTVPQTYSLVDAFYWSGRESLPFAPGEGSGFIHKSFGLTTINGAYRLFPYFATLASSSDERESSISMASCTDRMVEGFHSDQISAAGLPRAYVPPRGSLVYERFIATAPSKGVAGAADIALDVRRQVLGEQLVKLTGRVERMGSTAPLDSMRQASVLVSEGTLTTAVEKRVPWTEVVPDADGHFSALVPLGRSWVVEAHAFGQKQVEREYANVASDTDLGDFVLAATAQVSFTVKDAATMAPLEAEIFVVPVDEAERTKLTGSLHGRFTTCSPWLGPPPGASPACNRVLVKGGAATADVPIGKYDVYAFHGPYWSLARESVELVPGTKTMDFTLTRLPLKPAGALSSDMHVHGAASFDSSIPDQDRVLSFAASDLDVIIATDHDVIYDYGKVVRDLGFASRMTTVVGLETTGHIPFLYVPKYAYPLVIGHYNMWPLKYDPSLPRNGGPYDERVEPGELFERTKPLYTGLPLIELNHPWAEPEFGRDLGFPRAIFVDLRKNLPATDDGTPQGVYVRTPENATFANDGHHAQEVMNGSQNDLLLQYREFWFYTLNQGRLRAGTANSDSHSLTDNTVGMPHNLVFAETQAGPGFDVNVFNRAVRDGRMIGTNGPLIEVTVEDSAGVARTCSLTPFTPKDGATVKVKVRSAPWIPIEEIRFVVNGEVKKKLTGLALPADPFATGGDLVRYDGEVSLAEVLSGVSGDAWLVVEAGRALMLAGDLGGGLNNAQDGMPDTTDNNGDGKVDSADVKEGQKTGPIANPPAPKRGEAGFDYASITGGYPMAFTNPFILDRTGDGKFSGPGAKGGN